MTTPYQGGQALGEIIFGGREGGNSDAFLKRLRENYSTQKAMEDASTAQIQRIARESQTAETVAKATGLPLGQAAMIANALQSQESMNLNTAGVSPLQMQTYGLKNTAVEALTPDMGLGNAALAAIDGKPLKRNDVDSGYVLDPYVAGSGATATETENAKIGELDARANLSNVKAAGGGFAPKTPRSGGSGGAKRSAAAAKTIIATLQKEMGRKLTASEVDQVYAGGDFEFADAPKASLGEAANGKAPAGVDQRAYAKALQRKADAIRAIERGAPKEKVAERLRSTGNAKLADWLLENY